MQNLLLEFEGDNARAGFRLHRLEVRNWGTFHDKIWTLEPGGNTSLLTGANGSGKSTLVDALLTLLVPNTKRSYNQASGTERRRERDERTYVLGAYGKVKSDDGYAARTQNLRTKDDFSVLLAVFRNEAFRQTITLAQVFWIQDGTVRKFFVVATEALSIHQHFSSFTSIAELKKRLKAAETEIYDEFVHYSKRFCKIFGLRSDKALDLFNQTVALKEIGDLNDFVRTHMLEKTAVRDKIDQLQDSYENLTLSHEAMLKAQRQLEQLKPLLEEADKFEQAGQELATLELCADAVPVYFAAQTIDLLDRAASEAEHRLTQARFRQEALVQQLQEWRHQEQELAIAVNSDAAGQRLRELEREIQQGEKQLAGRKKEAERYQSLARPLDLPPNPDAAAFADSLYKGREIKQAIEDGLLNCRQASVEHQIRLRDLEERSRTLGDELASLRQRKSQIPSTNLQIRSRLLQALRLTEDEIPFAGELLQVREEARLWEGAIERLLHDFGLRLLVPEEHYVRVSRYVNETDLRGRLVFHKVSAARKRGAVAATDSDALIHKLEIKRDSSFHDWLANELTEHFDYICCESLEQFQRENRAITPTGFIKRGSSQHEKDDRRALVDPSHYILGWNNADKVNALMVELGALTTHVKREQDAIGALEQERRESERRRDLLVRFLEFEDYAAIDWQSDARENQKLRDEKTALEQSSDRLKELQRQLEVVTARVAQGDIDRESISNEIAVLRHKTAEFVQQRADCEVLRSNFDLETLAACTLRIEADHKLNGLSLANIGSLEEQILKSYREKVKRQNDRLSVLQATIVKNMQKYKGDYEAETTDIDASVEAISAFRNLLETIEREDLPRHEKRFKELLNQKVIAAIAFFINTLENQVEEIRDSIKNLNASLQSIDYTPSTFIQLGLEPNRDREIQEFRATLRACLPDVRQANTAETNEASFRKIKDLIARFENEERWTEKVTDVRNWLNFSASEKYKEDGSEKHYYSDSSGKSGGQKAKLAYTILASAIAYQFGLDHDQTRSKSFRFVVVDEAFSKTDEANARYAMELFQKLNLQLLVVTPMDKIHIVEPYIAACHFVSNNEAGNNSTVANIGIQQYHEQKLVFGTAMTRP